MGEKLRKFVAFALVCLGSASTTQSFAIPMQRRPLSNQKNIFEKFADQPVVDQAIELILGVAGAAVTFGLGKDYVDSKISEYTDKKKADENNLYSTNQITDKKPNAKPNAKPRSVSSGRANDVKTIREMTFAGFSNASCFCYGNSVMQCLFSSSHAREKILNWETQDTDKVLNDFFNDSARLQKAVSCNELGAATKNILDYVQQGDQRISTSTDYGGGSLQHAVSHEGSFAESTPLFIMLATVFGIKYVELGTITRESYVEPCQPHEHDCFNDNPLQAIDQEFTWGNDAEENKFICNVVEIRKAGDGVSVQYGGVLVGDDNTVEKLAEKASNKYFSEYETGLPNIFMGILNYARVTPKLADFSEITIKNTKYRATGINFNIGNGHYVCLVWDGTDKYFTINDGSISREAVGVPTLQNSVVTRRSPIVGGDLQIYLIMYEKVENQAP
jgi:hypothetical protein